MKNKIESIIDILNVSAEIGSFSEFSHLNFTDSLEKKLEYFLDFVRILNEDSATNSFENALNLIDDIFRTADEYNDVIIKIEGLLMEIHKIILEKYC